MTGLPGLIARYALWALLLAALVLPFVGGFPLAYFILLLALILAACWLLSRPRWVELAEPSGMMLAASFCLIAAALAASAERPEDILFAFNFVFFALYPLLRAAVGRFASPGGSLQVAQAALGGAMLSLAVATWQTMTVGRAAGIASDPIWSAQSAVILSFLALIRLFAARSGLRYLFLLDPASGLLAAILTGSRGPMLAAVPLALVALLLIPGRARIALLGLVLASALAVVPAPLPLPGTREAPLEHSRGRFRVDRRRGFP
jgi:O-antigen ligase